jgi:hypothetical protein
MHLGLPFDRAKPIVLRPAGFSDGRGSPRVVHAAGGAVDDDHSPVVVGGGPHPPLHQRLNAGAARPPRTAAAAAGSSPPEIVSISPIPFHTPLPKVPLLALAAVSTPPGLLPELRSAQQPFTALAGYHVSVLTCACDAAPAC